MWAAAVQQLLSSRLLSSRPRAFPTSLGIWKALSRGWWGLLSSRAPWPGEVVYGELHKLPVVHLGGVPELIVGTQGHTVPRLICAL